MDVDLNLDNYDLQELLNLFNLTYNFTIDDLKKTKKIVMQVHPDKSNLDKSYFLFYCKAFRMIKNIYDFKNKKQETLDYNNTNIDYLAESTDDKGKKLLVKNLLKKDKQFFHEWFNKTFEKININDEEKRTGYGDWFQSDADIDATETSQNMLHEAISKRKETLSSLINVKNIEASNNSGPTDYKNLGGDMPSSYSSDIFSKLPYEDLKKAHTETVVPVGTNDYNKVLKFNNVESLQQYRNQQNIKPMSNNDSNQYFDDLNNTTEQDSLQLAYKLARQDELVEEANKSWWSNLTRLK